MNRNPKYHFDIHASVVMQLGDNLISDVAQALVELVKNSYDADATYSKVVVNTEEQLGEGFYYSDASGYISIEDNGIGMDKATIERGWLTVSNSPKREMKRKGLTTARGRTPLGDKGLGRLGAQRLANNVEIFTRPEGSAVEYHVGFSWSSFLEDGLMLTQVPIFFDEIEPQREHGTKLIISGIKDKESWINDTIDDLEKSLSQLISPYEEVKDFILAIVINGRRLELAEYSLDLKKYAIANYVFDFDEDQLRICAKAKLDFFKPRYRAPEAEKKDYRMYVQEDKGEELANFIMHQGQAERFHINKSEEEFWYIEYGHARKLIEITGVKLLQRTPANPGPFHGELDSFKFEDAPGTPENLSGKSVQGSFIKDLGGLRVYRDGFGIRTDNDLLELRKQQTSGRSWYGLRPENIIGYIALSTKENAVLHEKTDREGFQNDQYYGNFYLLLQEFSKFTSDAQNFLRRGYNNFINQCREKKPIVTEKTVEEISHEISTELADAIIHEESLKNMQKSLGDVVEETRQIREITQNTLPDNAVQRQTIEIATQNITHRMEHARREINQAEIYLNTLPSVKQKVDLLDSQLSKLQGQIAILGEQLSQTYETVSLGLTAETLSHEITNITDQLARRNRQVMEYIIKFNITDMMFTEFTRYINTAVASLRKQLSHLEPSLRYVRENREEIIISEYFEEIKAYYAGRFAAYNIKMQIEDSKSTEKFVLRMNRGKLNQIVDNLLLNSEYWLREDIRIQRIKSGVITIDLSKPFIRISDNGRGIDPTVEKSLFEPFVTTKGQGRGRGLGLFIVQQLLGSENCSVSLLPDRNEYGKLYIFEIDFAGGLFNGK